jgi:hypothetical protein
MPPTWRRVWFRFFPELPVDEDDLSHDEKVEEAKTALREGKRKQAEVSRLGDQVALNAERLGDKHRRNHFSEGVAQMLHDGYRS